MLLAEGGKLGSCVDKTTPPIICNALVGKQHLRQASHSRTAS